MGQADGVLAMRGNGLAQHGVVAAGRGDVPSKRARIRKVERDFAAAVHRLVDGVDQVALLPVLVERLTLLVTAFGFPAGAEAGS